MSRMTCHHTKRSLETLEGTDFSAEAKFPMVLVNVQVMRCTRCRKRLIDDAAADLYLRAAANQLLHLPTILTGPQARFLRARLRLSQVQLGKLMGVTSRAIQTWERGGRFTPQNDFILRAICSVRIPTPGPWNFLDRVRSVPGDAGHLRVDASTSCVRIDPHAARGPAPGT